MAERALATVSTDRGLVGGPFGSSLVGTDYAASGVPVIRGTNMTEGRHIGGEFVFVTEAKFASELERNSARPGDLVFTQRGTLGQVAIVPEGKFPNYVISQSQMRLRVDQAVSDPRFVYYACTTPVFLKQINDNAISTGVPHINLGILARLTIPDVPRGQQRAIAEVLGALDDKIAANDRLTASAEKLIVSNAAMASETVLLREITTQSTSSMKPEQFDTQVLHFSLPAFDTGAVPDLADREWIKSNKFLIEAPCVLMSKLNPRIPRVWHIGTVPNRMAVASTEFVVLVPNGFDAALLWAVLNQPPVWTELAGKVAGTSGSHQRVRPAEMLALRVGDPRTLPPHVREVMSRMADLCKSRRDESSLLAKTRDALLPLLMSGKVRVRDAQKVVEEVV